MKVETIHYEGEGFTIRISEAIRQDVVQIRNLTDEIQGIIPPKLNDVPDYAEPRNWDRENQLAFLVAARQHLAESKNKIMTIKHLRSLSVPMLTLRDAKEIADVAAGESLKVFWFKD